VKSQQRTSLNNERHSVTFPLGFKCW